MGLFRSLFKPATRCPACGRRAPLNSAAFQPGPRQGEYRCASCGETFRPDTSPANPAAPEPEFTADNSIHIAAEQGDTARVRRFLDAGESPDAPDPVGLGPLHYAAPKNRLGVLRLLLDRGADPNARGQGGLAPIHGAAFRGALGSITLLVGRGADPNARTDAGATPLTIARTKDQHDAARLIEQLGGTT